MSRHDNLTGDQAVSVALLIGACEAVVGAGILSEAKETRLRRVIVDACNAFGLPTLAERTEPPFSAPRLGTPHNSGEREPAAMPAYSGAEIQSADAARSLSS